MMKPQPNEIWLVQFPFSDLTSNKLRPALVISLHREDAILIGIFSKIPIGLLKNTWVLISDHNPNFQQTGLKKSSLIRADKIATVHTSIFVRKLGILPNDLVYTLNGLELNFLKMPKSIISNGFQSFIRSPFLSRLEYILFN